MLPAKCYLTPSGKCEIDTCKVLPALTHQICKCTYTLRQVLNRYLQSAACSGTSDGKSAVDISKDELIKCLLACIFTPNDESKFSAKVSMIAFALTLVVAFCKSAKCNCRVPTALIPLYFRVDVMKLLKFRVKAVCDGTLYDFYLYCCQIGFLSLMAFHSFATIRS